MKTKFLACLFMFGISGICSVLGVSGSAWAQVTGQFPFTGSSRSLQPPLPRTVLSSEGFKLGPVRVRPSLGYAQVFTDNAFRTNINRQSDFGYTIAPGIQAHLPIGDQHEFLVDYRAAQQYFQRFSANNNFLHEGSAVLKLNYPSGLKVMFQGANVVDFDPRGSILDLDVEDMTRWSTNTFVGRAQYLGPHTGFRFTLQSMQWNFLNNNQSPFRDRLTNSSSLTFYGRATRNTLALLNFGIAKTNYDDNKQLNNFAYSIQAGFAIPVATHLTGEFRIGITYLNFDRAAIPLDQEPPEGLSRGGDTQERLTLRGDFNWDPTSRLNVFLRTFRQIRQAGVFEATTFTSTGFFMIPSYSLGDRTSVFGITSYSLNEFSGETLREDQMFGQSVGLNYQAVKWLGLRLQYNYIQRLSNLPQNEFFANNIMLSIQGVL